MNEDLMSLPLRDLLQRFAAGNHKPGSGSAAALLGLISASLSKTVIALTKNRGGKYENVQGELGGLLEEIESEIVPLLEKAFIEDSIQFGIVIQARNSRDEAETHSEWWQRSHVALTQMDAASRIALTIARASIRLSEISIAVFDKGFASARGDSEVAIEAAISGATGALSVVYLNLKDFRGEPYARDVLDEACELTEKAEFLQVELRKRMESLKDRAIKENKVLSLNAPTLLLKKKKKSQYSKTELSEIARNLQLELWKNRKEIWPHAEPVHPIHIIDPGVTFRLHGYDYEEVTTLGIDRIDGENVEIAGYVDLEQRTARISKKFSLEMRRFTAAHELGHAILHNGAVMFRDRGLDGGPVTANRPRSETEADSFAAFFLMPELQVNELFRMKYGVEAFVADKNTAFALGFQSLTAMKNRLPTLRHVSVHLATVDMYSGNPSRSLSDVFGVSPLALAIRIEELGIIPNYP
jgi:formiminotetrahydrofolate cyclodeaminase